MNVKRYRRRYEAEIKKAADSYRSSSAEDTERLLAEKSADAEARVNAIATTDLDAENIDRLIGQYLRTLRDGGESVAVRSAAFNALKVAEFLGPRFEAHRADYLQALREVATDRSQKLRQNALEMLAINKDPYAQEVLLRGLRDAKAALVPLAKAIQFLGYDDHADAAGAVRTVFAKASNAAKEEALRLLASHPGSQRFLSRLLGDKSQRSNIRQLSASALQNLDPNAFKRAARRIVADEDDYNEIRATCLAALTNVGDKVSTAADRSFVDLVSKLTEKTRSTNLRASIKRFLVTTQS